MHLLSFIEHVDISVSFTRDVMFESLVADQNSSYVNEVFNLTTSPSQALRGVAILWYSRV